MIETKDPAIKLFGQKILFPEEAEDMEVEEEDRYFSESEEETTKDHEAERETEKRKEVDPPPNSAETKNNNSATSIEEETSKSKTEQSDTNNNSNNNNEKTLKKPDKLLPCPRCNSADTKFCYYNNYNVNQPRYFCKACQRYWTAGGTMRNVPVGAGRRKNKNNSSSHYHHVTISEALDAARVFSPPDETHYVPNLKTNGRLLSFGLDHPSICNSMESVLNPAETKGLNDTRNNGDHCSSVSSNQISKSMGQNVKNISQESLPQQNSGFVPQVPCITSVPWPYPWSSSAIPSTQTLCPPGFPMSFYPTPFWNSGAPGNWNVPWFPSHTSPTNPPTPGKRSRDYDGDDDNNEDTAKQDDFRKEEPPRPRNGCVLVPKTLRIDDPNEAAKSSIWETLGIKNECVSRGDMTKAFQPKKDGKEHVETSPMLMANPAALARSLNFHENS